MAARLEIHLEWPYHAVMLPEEWASTSNEGSCTTYRLLALLQRHHLQAEFYILGHLAEHDPALVRDIHRDGHAIGSHGYWHRHNEHEGDNSDELARRYLPECVGYRSPFWDHSPRPGMAGGVFFRTLPHGLLKQQIRQQGTLYLHPHDFYSSGYGPWRRHLFFCRPWERLERLLTEVEWTK